MIAEKQEGVCYQVGCQRLLKGLFVCQQEKDSPSVAYAETL